MKKLMLLLLLTIGYVFAQQSNADTTKFRFEFEKEFDLDADGVESIDIYFKDGKISNYPELSLEINSTIHLGEYTESLKLIALPDSIIINLFDIDKIVEKDINGNEIKTTSGTELRMIAESASLALEGTTKSVELFGGKYLIIKKYIPYIIIGSIVVLLTIL